MNKIIGGKRYDTEKAAEAGRTDNGLPYMDLDYYSETLYRKRTGEFFLHLEGGARSALAEPRMGGTSGGERIRPLPYEEAVEWAERNLDADGYADLFGEPDDDRETVVTTLRLSAASKARLEREASRTGLTQSALVDRLIESM